jgi:hypothetical protein
MTSVSILVLHHPLSDSFINDTSQLGYTQDNLDCVNADSVVENCEYGESSLHRQIYHLREMESQMKTPILNRRMRNPTVESQDSEHSQKGLGNMHFIRSVLDYHRA